MRVQCEELSYLYRGKINQFSDSSVTCFSFVFPVKCPLGTYFDSASRTCEVCQHGFYQDEEGAKACKKCPQGTSTSGSLRTDFHDCKGIRVS